MPVAVEADYLNIFGDPLVQPAQYFQNMPGQTIRDTEDTIKGQFLILYMGGQEGFKLFIGVPVV